MVSKTRPLAAALVAIAAAGLGACNDPADPEHHIVPVGLVILQDGTQIVAATSAGATGSITATGLQSEPLTVQYLNIEGEPIDPGVEYHLAVQSAEPGTVMWEPDQAGSFTGRAEIRATGATTLRFRWVHGPVGSGHSDLDIDVPASVTLVQQPENIPSSEERAR